jgi:hypothetical protein
MPTYIALLRAVNVGGTGKLPMAELKAMGEQAGFANVRTFIASGNLLFESAQTEKQVTAALASRLAAYAGKPVGVLVRTGAELAAVLAANPFASEPPNRVMAFSRWRAAGRCARSRHRSQGRTLGPRPTRDLCALCQRYGRFAAHDGGGSGWHRAQYEYRRQAGCDGDVIVRRLKDINRRSWAR